MSSQSSTTQVSLCAKGPTTSPAVHSPLAAAQEPGSGEPTRVGAAWEGRRKAAPSASATSRSGGALCAAWSRGSAASRGACTLAAMVAAAVLCTRSRRSLCIRSVAGQAGTGRLWLACCSACCCCAAAPSNNQRDRGASRTVCAAAVPAHAPHRAAACLCGCGFAWGRVSPQPLGSVWTASPPPPQCKCPAIKPPPPALMKPVPLTEPARPLC